jgi:hypothetical protein
MAGTALAQSTGTDTTGDSLAVKLEKMNLYYENMAAFAAMKNEQMVTTIYSTGYKYGNEILKIAKSIEMKDLKGPDLEKYLFFTGYALAASPLADNPLEPGYDNLLLINFLRKFVKQEDKETKPFFDAHCPVAKDLFFEKYSCAETVGQCADVKTNKQKLDEAALAKKWESCVWEKCLARISNDPSIDSSKVVHEEDIDGKKKSFTSIQMVNDFVVDTCLGATSQAALKAKPSKKKAVKKTPAK